jgi:regulator of protease activity HflC (stomatin/prohibitin superfamily)
LSTFDSFQIQWLFAAASVTHWHALEHGAGKGRLVSDVTKHLGDVLGSDGFVIDQLTINGALRLPENVAQAINRAMEATQNAARQRAEGEAVPC